MKPDENATDLNEQDVKANEQAQVPAELAPVPVEPALELDEHKSSGQGKELSSEPDLYAGFALVQEGYIQRPLTGVYPLCDLDEEHDALVYCWPFTPTGEDEEGAGVPHKFGLVKKSTDPVVVVTSIFLLAWILLLIFPLYHLQFGFNFFPFVKAIPLALIPLFSRRGLTHIRVTGLGVRFECVSGKRLIKKQQILWRDIESIKLQRAKQGHSPLRATLILKLKHNLLPKRIPLKKISSAREWRKLVSALDHFCTKRGISKDLDIAYLDGIGDQVNDDDPTYTKLWLDALSAPPKRERLLPLSIGTELQSGKFTIEQKLGTGGQGSAYLACTTNGAQVVLKEYILPVYVDKPVRKHAIESFHHEAQMIDSLSNEHIVKLLDSFVEDQRAYLVLEFIHGVSLRELVKRDGPITEETCVELALQMCAALDYLHHLSPALVHQDFTPDNLILDDRGKLTLIDFMVAKELVGEESMTSTVVGKHHYMPPEQFRGKATTQSDIYALGATLHFLLTGKDPQPMTVTHPILLNENVSGALDTIVANATQLDCARRYRDINDVRDELLKLQSQSNTPAC